MLLNPMFGSLWTKRGTGGWGWGEGMRSQTTWLKKAYHTRRGDGAGEALQRPLRVTLEKLARDLLTIRFRFSTSLSSLQSAEEEAAPSLDAEEDVGVAPPLRMSAEELAFSEFISV